MFDSHIHTEFSTDSNMKIEDAVCKSQMINTGLVLTEHMDLSSIKDIENLSNGFFVFDMKEYFKKYMAYKKYNVLLGVEFGMKLKPELVDAYKKFTCDFPLDYVLGSIHSVNGMSVGNTRYFKEKSKEEAFECYLNCMLENLKKYNFIDCLAHIDYICRYSTYDDNELYYERHKILIDEIFRVMIENEIVFEINSKRLGDKKSAESIHSICQRYKELGGSYVTIGSDAHSVDQIGANWKVAKDIADNCDLRVVYFKDRRINYI